MKYDHDKKWVRKVLMTADIMNTFNGGISQPRLKLEKNDDHYLLQAVIPGVDIEDIKVEIVDQNLLVYHKIGFSGKSDSTVDVPHVVATCLLSPEIDFRNISAAVEAGILQVVLPINELKAGYYKDIEIRR